MTAGGRFQFLLLYPISSDTLNSVRTSASRKQVQGACRKMRNEPARGRVSSMRLGLEWERVNGSTLLCSVTKFSVYAN
jgi:hypothetical protein